MRKGRTAATAKPLASILTAHLPGFGVPWAAFQRGLVEALCVLEDAEFLIITGPGVLFEHPRSARGSQGAVPVSD